MLKTLTMYLSLMLASIAAAPPVFAAALDDAMGAVKKQDWDTARRIARSDSAVTAAIVDWHWLRMPNSGAPFSDYRAFAQTYPHWPGMPLLQRRGENAIPASADPAQVIAYFANQPPQTGTGALRLAVALQAQGRADDAGAEAVRAWTNLSLSAQDESVMLARFGPQLGDHHIARLDNLLWRGWYNEAERMRNRVPAGHRALLDARRALRQDTAGVDSFISAVPDDLQSDPGLAYERMEWRKRKGRSESAVELMLERSATAERLGRPEMWAKRRRPEARQLMRNGDARRAYLLAAQHHLSEGSDYADLEWLSGYIALRKLNNPAAALDHFRRFRMAVVSPISLGRAGYWEGRALDALENPIGAAAAYGFGAEFQTSFYGQLAAEQAGVPMEPEMTGSETFPDSSQAAFKQSSIFKAGVALHQADELVLSARFLAHLAESLTRTEIGQLLDATDGLGAPYIQLTIAKRAASMGHTLHAGYFPLMDLSTSGRPDVSPELALSIARRESEFNPVVISPAGARGLMQVMPGTASDTAAELGLSYALGRLTSDPAYNATLGTAYLQKLRNEFGGSTVLVAAGYNAGPGRPRSWVKTYGDPRDASVDAVDWVEHVPFRETRNYVMRVTESLAPYRARLSGQTVPLTLGQELKAR